MIESLYYARERFPALSKVKKVTGYPGVGIVASIFLLPGKTEEKDVRVVVQHKIQDDPDQDGGFFLHIYSLSQLERVE